MFSCPGPGGYGELHKVQRDLNGCVRGPAKNALEMNNGGESAFGLEKPCRCCRCLASFH